MAAVAGFLLDPPQFATQSPERTATPRTEWVDIIRPFELYALPSQVFGVEPRQFSARRHQAGGDRIDALAFGPEEPGAANWLRIEIRRFGAAQEPAVAFYPEMARLAARSGGSIARSGLPGVTETRFGPVETADLQLAAGEKYAACLGFRLPRQEPGIGFAGIGCGTAEKPLDRALLACALNRLDLISSGDDRALGDWFAQAERRRGRDCAQARTAHTPGRPDWLAPSAPALPLKGSLARAGSHRR